MSYIDDIVTDIMARASKTGSVNKGIATKAVEDAIEEINALLDSSVVKGRDTVDVTAEENSTTLPAQCKRVIELGKWDATRERIIRPYTEITESQMERIYSGAATIESADDPFAFHFLDDTNEGVNVIRILPPPKSPFTLGVRYFERLDKGNAHRLENSALITNGAAKNLPLWFGNAWSISAQMFQTQINDTRASHMSIHRQFRMRQDPRVRRRNYQSLIIR